MIHKNMRVLTWNICGDSVSFQCGGELNLDEKYRAVWAVIDSHDPGVILIQEGTEGFAKSAPTGYRLLGSTGSHSGLVQTFAKTSLIQEKETSTTPSDPTLVTELLNVSVVNCHLSPYRTLSSLRFRQLKQALEGLGAEQAVVVAGDMNMRNDEPPRIASRLHLHPFPPPRDSYTWNSHDNRYHKKGYGYFCNFDRVFTRACELADYQLVKGEIDAEKGIYLSDHYGICFTISVPRDNGRSTPLDSGAAR